MGGQQAFSAAAVVCQCCGDVGGRGKFAFLLRPFDQADAVCGKQFVQPRVFPFFGEREAVEVEMVQGEAFQRIRFDDGVGRALTAP